MRQNKQIIYCFLVFFLFFTSLSFAQVKLTGEISGLVEDQNGEALPGVSVTLTGEKLFQKSLSAVSNEKGFFRFLNLNPGNYTLEFALQGFNTLKLTPVAVSVGKSTPIRAALAQTRLTQEVVVKAEAPLIETKTVQLSTNFNSALVEQIPTNRNVQDLMESTPGINDHGAYGAGARVRTDYYQGSQANAYLLNGVDISDLSTGATWVNPDYDTIDEIQIVGMGATAEYGNYTGAVLNIITKTGGNSFHGGLSSYFTSKALYGDNSGGIKDLTPEEIKYNTETTASLGGPLIKEKLFFFLAGGYTGLQNRHYLEPAYGLFKQPHFQANVNWIPSQKHAFTLMVNLDPLNHDNLGLLPNSGPEIGYSRVFRSTVWNASWKYFASDKTYFDLKYAGFHGRDLTDPVSPNTVAIMDYSTYRAYGSSGVIRDSLRTRHQVNASMTQYLENFLKSSHEIKLGFEYERSSADDNIAATGPNASLFEIYPFLNLYWVIGYENERQMTKANVDRIGGFFQDNIQIGRKASLNLGVRLDSPKLTTPDLSGTIVKYTSVAPRLGFSYDFGGDARTVIHLGYGRYYDKMVTESFGYALPGLGEIKLYSAFLTSPFVPTPENIASLPSQILRPENLYFVLPAAQTLPVDPNLSGPYSDVFNATFEKELFRDFALSLEYVHKEDRNFIRMLTSTPHTYNEVQWTDPFLGNTISVWDQTDRTPDSWRFANSTWAKRRHDFLMITLRKRQIGKWSLMSSFVYQNSRGNDDNTTGPVGYNWGQDTNPNYTQNPLIWGNLTFDRTYQFKLMGTYLLPLGIYLSGDMHVLSGLAWQPGVGFNFTGLYGGQLDKLLIEQRGNRRTPWTWYLNLRADKTFRLGNFSNLEFIADFINVFNRANAASIATEPYAVFPISGDKAFGKVFQLAPPFHARFGVRWAF